MRKCGEIEERKGHRLAMAFCRVPGGGRDAGFARAPERSEGETFIPPAANSTGPFTWSSDPTQNSDGIQHIYSTDVVAGQAYAGSPAGTLGDEVDLGSANAGDSLTFLMYARGVIVKPGYSCRNSVDQKAYILFQAGA
jgi:hypothetical protein